MADLFLYFSSIGILEIIGVAGFICYLLAFGAVQFGLFDGNSAAYSLANITAASLVAVSLFAEFNLASALIQGSWIILGLVGLARRARAAEEPLRCERTTIQKSKLI